MEKSRSRETTLPTASKEKALRAEGTIKKAIIVVHSYHHNNTLKVARAIGKVLDSEVKSPEQANPGDLALYDLVGFGSGIDSGKHYREVLEFAEKLPPMFGKKAFVFSTSGTPIGLAGQHGIEEYTSKCHSTLIETLRAKGYTIVGEFGCAGFNTNSFLRLFGGINKGRPSAEDLKHAEEFAMKLRA